MGRRPLVDVEPPQAPPQAPPGKPEQLGLFGPPATTRVMAGTGLLRLTWRDHVVGLREDVRAAGQPAWKLRFDAGDYLLLRPARDGAPSVTAIVTVSTRCPDDFALPVLVQCKVHVDGAFAEETMIPVTAVEKHLDKDRIPF